MNYQVTESIVQIVTRIEHQLESDSVLLKSLEEMMESFKAEEHVPFDSKGLVSSFADLADQVKNGQNERPWPIERSLSLQYREIKDESADLEREESLRLTHEDEDYAGTSKLSDIEKLVMPQVYTPGVVAMLSIRLRRNVMIIQGLPYYIRKEYFDPHTFGDKIKEVKQELYDIRDQLLDQYKGSNEEMIWNLLQDHVVLPVLNHIETDVRETEVSRAKQILLEYSKMPSKRLNFDGHVPESKRQKVVTLLCINFSNNLAGFAELSRWLSEDLRLDISSIEKVTQNSFHISVEDCSISIEDLQKQPLGKAWLKHCFSIKKQNEKCCSLKLENDKVSESLTKIASRVMIWLRERNPSPFSCDYENDFLDFSVFEDLSDLFGESVKLSPRDAQKSFSNLQRVSEFEKELLDDEQVIYDPDYYDNIKYEKKDAWKKLALVLGYDEANSTDIEAFIAASSCFDFQCEELEKLVHFWRDPIILKCMTLTDSQEEFKDFIQPFSDIKKVELNKRQTLSSVEKLPFSTETRSVSLSIPSELLAHDEKLGEKVKEGKAAKGRHQYLAPSTVKIIPSTSMAQTQSSPREKESQPCQSGTVFVNFVKIASGKVVSYRVAEKSKVITKDFVTGTTSENHETSSSSIIDAKSVLTHHPSYSHIRVESPTEITKALTFFNSFHTYMPWIVEILRLNGRRRECLALLLIDVFQEGQLHDFIKFLTDAQTEASDREKIFEALSGLNLEDTKVSKVVSSIIEKILHSENEPVFDGESVKKLVRKLLNSAPLSNFELLKRYGSMENLRNAVKAVTHGLPDENFIEQTLRVCDLLEQKDTHLFNSFIDTNLVEAFQSNVSSTKLFKIILKKGTSRAYESMIDFFLEKTMEDLDWHKDLDKLLFEFFPKIQERYNGLMKKAQILLSLMFQKTSDNAEERSRISNLIIKYSNDSKFASACTLLLAKLRNLATKDVTKTAMIFLIECLDRNLGSETRHAILRIFAETCGREDFDSECASLIFQASLWRDNFKTDLTYFENCLQEICKNFQSMLMKQDFSRMISTLEVFANAVKHTAPHVIKFLDKMRSEIAKYRAELAQETRSNRDIAEYVRLINFCVNPRCKGCGQLKTFLLDNSRHQQVLTCGEPGRRCIKRCLNERIQVSPFERVAKFLDLDFEEVSPQRNQKSFGNHYIGGILIRKPHIGSFSADQMSQRCTMALKKVQDAKARLYGNLVKIEVFSID